MLFLSACDLSNRCELSATFQKLSCLPATMLPATIIMDCLHLLEILQLHDSFYKSFSAMVSLHSNTILTKTLREPETILLTHSAWFHNSDWRLTRPLSLSTVNLLIKETVHMIQKLPSLMKECCEGFCLSHWLTILFKSHPRHWFLPEDSVRNSSHLIGWEALKMLLFY